MPRLLVEIDAAPVDWRHWSSAVPLLVARLRELTFDPDGVVRLDSGRREGLRLLSGVAGQVGATYRVVTNETVTDPTTGEIRTDPAAPYTLTVEHDDARLLGVSVTAAEATLTVRIEAPTSATRASATACLTLSELPAWLGQQLELEGTVDVSDPAHPALNATGRMRRATASARLEHVGETLRADLRVRPRGALVLAGLAWPLVRGRARDTVAEEMTGWWAGVVATLTPDRSVRGLVDEAVAELERDLVEHVPA